MKILLIVSLMLGLTPFFLRAYTALRYHPRIYTVEEVPKRRVALILGAQVFPSGRLSAMLKDRVAAGVDLYQAGKVDYLLMSGDGRSEHYHEPAAMKRYALTLGVPEDAILLDPAGIRTFESCIRARDTFNFDEIILVTQDFHLDRALLLCHGLGLDAVGVAADYQRPWGYARRSIQWSNFREIPATTIAVIDLLRWQLGF